MIIFGLIISYAVIPVVHQIRIHGLFGYEVQKLASGFVIMVGIYMVGAIVYAFNIPEVS